MSTKTITDIVDAMHAGDMQEISAASLRHVWECMRRLNVRSFAMLSSWRADQSREENERALGTFRADIRALGYGRIELIGHWDSEREPSFFVPGMTLAAATRLGRKYRQEAVVHGGPDTDGHVVLVYSDGQQEPLADRFTPQALGKAFSELAGKRGRKFAFMTVAANSQMEFLAAIVYERDRYPGTALYSKLTF